MARNIRRAVSPVDREGSNDPGVPNSDVAPEDAIALKAAKLDYMRQMLKELRTMAQEMREGTLVYLLDVAILEIDENADLAKFRQELRN